MSKPDIDMLYSEVERLLREACAASFMGSRAMMAVDFLQSNNVEEFRLFARDYHDVVFGKLDELETKVRALVAATKH